MPELNHTARGTFSGGKVNQTRALLSAGADINARDNDGYTPLHLARDAAQTSVLLAAGADVNARNEYGKTPLHYARGTDQTSALLAADANPNARDNYDVTPLNASDSGKMKILLAAGADPLLAYPPAKTRIAEGCLAALRDPEVVSALKPQTASRLVDAHPYLADLPGDEKPEALLARAAAENRMAERLARPSLAARIAEHAAQPEIVRDAPGIDR